jgi:hypothetical protein
MVRRLRSLLGSTKRQLLAETLQGPANPNGLGGQIDILPAGPQRFPQPQTDRKRDREQGADPILLRTFEKHLRLFRQERPNFDQTARGRSMRLAAFAA